jgi:hypothetical protein
MNFEALWGTPPTIFLQKNHNVEEYKGSNDYHYRNLPNYQWGTLISNKAMQPKHHAYIIN